MIKKDCGKKEGEKTEKSSPILDMVWAFSEGFFGGQEGNHVKNGRHPT